MLAAHPFFLPARLCPDDKTLRDDHGRLDFETEWGSLAHASVSDPTLTTEKSIEAVPDIGRGGLFIRSPNAELAVGRKNLIRAVKRPNDTHEVGHRGSVGP